VATPANTAIYAALKPYAEGPPTCRAHRCSNITNCLAQLVKLFARAPTGMWHWPAQVESNTQSSAPTEQRTRQESGSEEPSCSRFSRQPHLMNAMEPAFPCTHIGLRLPPPDWQLARPRASHSAALVCTPECEDSRDPSHLMADSAALAERPAAAIVAHAPDPKPPSYATREQRRG